MKVTHRLDTAGCQNKLELGLKTGLTCVSVADPGFPVGGVHLLGDVDLRRRHFLPKMHVKMKELDPIGGHVPGTPPRSANVSAQFMLLIAYRLFSPSSRRQEGNVFATVCRYVRL